jgi:hypothetical protein
MQKDALRRGVVQEIEAFVNENSLFRVEQGENGTGLPADPLLEMRP